MIQRIQTVYLFLASVFLFLFTLLHPNGILGEFNNFLTFTGLISTILIFASIFLFKNRKNQMKLVLSCIFFSLALLGPIYNSLIGFSNFLNEWTHALPFLGIVLLILAYKAIKADERLIQSSNRLR